jgi:hypothetical protein
MVAGLRVMKGHAIVVEAAARLAARGVRPHFAFVGRGSVEPLVRDAIERAGLGAQFSLVGFVDDLPAVLAALDVALYVPLESDGMSRVVFESLAAGRPLVASRVGVTPELVLLACVQRRLAQPVKRTVLGGGHQPSARVVGHAGLGPVFERGDQRVLRQLFGQADVAHQPCDASHDFR